MNAKGKEYRDRDRDEDRYADAEKEKEADREEKESIDEEMVTVYVADAALDLGGLKQVKQY